MLLATKLKNAIIRASAGMQLSFTLRNIVVNGERRGCSGFIRNKANGSVVYVDTERPAACLKNFMYRYADEEKDFCGYRNHWTDTEPELVREILRMLQKTPAEADEYRI